MLAYLLLGVAQTVGLLMIPLGAPGVWVQLGALALFAWSTDFAVVGTAPLLVLLLVALTAELLEPPLARDGLDRRVRRKLGFGGLAGGGAGAGLGYLFPLLGSLFGALLGTLVGTLAVAPTVRVPRSGCMASAGQALAVTIRIAAGLAVAIFAAYSLLG